MRFLNLLALLALASVAFAQPPEIPLWPGTPPGDQAGALKGEERNVTKPTDNLVAGKPVIRLGDVSKPTLTVYRAPGSRDKAAPAVVVCPGGGYHILAMDLEGTEVCEWLNSIGITGVLLKYRVPKREGIERHAAALQDAQRALGIVRHRAAEFGIQPDRIGILGFSAGGHLAAAASTNYRERSYPAVDAVDEVSCRPDFTLLIYPAYLTVKEKGDALAPELPLTKDTPPAFMIITQDDPVRVENVLYYALGLKKAGVPMELHLYPKGGHGYGLRPTKLGVTAWPHRAAEWLRGSILNANP